MSQISYYTHEGLEKLKAELLNLERVERPNATKAVAEAREKKEIYLKMQNMMLHAKPKAY